jgi:methyl-accepting chemotaxis protein
MRKLKDMKLGHKLIALFMAMASIIALTGSFGIWSINRVSGGVQELLKARASQQKLVMLMKINLQESRVLLLKAVMAQNRDTFEAARDEYQAKTEFVTNYCDIMMNGNPTLEIPPTPKGSPLIANIQSLQQTFTAFKEVGTEIVVQKEQALHGAAATDGRLQQLVSVDIEKVSEDVKESVDDLLNKVGDLMVGAYADARAIQLRAEMMFFGVIVGGILLALLFGLLSKRSIVGRIDVMAKALSRGAEGDLTTKLAIESADELGQLSQNFNVMVERLSEIIGKIKRSIDVLGQVSQNIQGVSGRSISAAEIQADGINRTSISITQIDASINEVARGMDTLSLSATTSSSAINELVVSLEEVVANVDELAMSVESVTASVIEMATSIKQIDTSVASLVEASATTASSVADMSTSIKEVELNAIDNARISSEVLRDAEEGREAVQATIAGMQEIKRSSAITSEVISTLSTRAGEIGKIISVIDEVSEQTTLLAFNAAIIAAQAGVHGRGFAVVAEEIKALANRTSSSTGEIAAVIKAVRSETLRAVEAIQDAEKSIIDGERLSVTSGKALAKIVSGVKTASEQMDKIAAATEEQGKGSETIRNAMNRVSEMIGQIAKATKEQGKGSELIMTAAQVMRDLTSQVAYATREQSQTGNLIGESTANISDLIRQMKYICDEQSRGSNQILLSVEAIQKTTEVNVESVKVMDDSTKRLTVQTELLQGEISGFTVSN